MVDSFDKFFKQKKTISLEPRKSVRIASQPHRVSYINLETPEPCMQRQSSLYLSKNSSITLASWYKSSSAYSLYDCNIAKKEKLLEEIFHPHSQNTLVENHQPFDLSLSNDFLTKWSKRPLAESKTFNLEELKNKQIKLADILQPLGWKEFFQIKETIYPNLVKTFYFTTTHFPDQCAYIKCPVVDFKVDLIQLNLQPGEGDIIVNPEQMWWFPPL